MRARTSTLVLLSLLCSCFRGEFLDGVACTKDADCYPRFHCIPIDEELQADPPPEPYDGTCREPPLPSGTSSSDGPMRETATGDTTTGDTTTGTG